MEEIPTYSYRDNNIGELISSALSKVGFVILSDHNIKEELIREVYDSWTIFFDSYEKRKYSHGLKKPSGFYDYWEESIEFKEKGIPKESFYYRPENNILNIHKELFIPIKRIYTKLDSLSHEILLILCKNAPKYIRPSITKCLQRKPYSSLRSIYSPPLNNDVNINKINSFIRNPAHQDIDIITLLPTATISGLQIFSDKKWINVNSNFGDIIINNGDTLNLMSNGFYKSTTHRVVYNQETMFCPRYSMAFFCSIV